MPDIRAILSLQPIAAEWNGCRFEISRPTLADLVEAVDVNTKSPENARAWCLYRHCQDTDGKPLFADVADAMAAPAGFAAKVVPQIEALYNEGVD